MSVINGDRKLAVVRADPQCSPLKHVSHVCKMIRHQRLLMKI